ncbi:MAG: UbiX family flavin prenyltransferase [Deferrisomatales bacterium]|nr:UbiX family flavin prenyltransferase [Deferrisomatales bacterium]
MRRLTVGITGATGAIFGVRLVEALHDTVVETHLVMSDWGRRTIEHETSYSVAEVEKMAAVVHDYRDQGATISSGSFRTEGMVVAPCSMKTLAAIAAGLAENLVQRAADVVLKEQRKLVLMVREMPLSPIHLENMLKLARLGVVVLPPMPAFYNKPQSLGDMVDHVVARVLDQFDIPAAFAKRWDGVVERHGEQPETEGRQGFRIAASR